MGPRCIEDVPREATGPNDQKTYHRRERNDPYPSSRVTAATTTPFGPFSLGESAPLLVIAEIGVNHNGDRATGLRQVVAAIGAGARAVKFQSFRADELASRSAPKAEYQKRAGSDTQLDMLRRLELPAADLAAYRAEAARSGAIAFSTPFDPESARQLARAGVELMKLPSGEITNHDLIAVVGSTGLPTIMSTGMSTMEEVAAAVQVHRRSGGGPLALLHCVSSYPAPIEEQNLRAISALRERFGVPVGLSDHTVGRDAAVAAVALGADLIEKHFTVDRSLPGPDHAMSMEPAEFAELIDVLARVRAGLGTGVKGPAASELEIKALARRSIVAARDLRAGAVLARSDLALKRPGTGLAPGSLPELLGRALIRDIAADEQLRSSDVSSGSGTPPNPASGRSSPGSRAR
jgi:sialic acid synthase SpsE